MTENTNYIPSPNAMTLQEVAAVLGKTYSAIYSAVQNGHLNTHKCLGRVVVEPNDLENYRRCLQWLESKRKDER